MSEVTMADTVQGVEALAPRGPHSGVRRVSVVHCFEFATRRYAYFVRTGDIVRLSPPAFDALSMLDHGEDLATIAAALNQSYGEEIARGVLTEIEGLTAEGYLSRELEFTGVELEGDVQNLMRHHPRNIMFLVTEACNLACTYCYELQQGVHAKARTLKKADARKIIDAYFEGSLGRDQWTVTFFGGEPLLNFPVVRETTEYALQRAKELGKAVDFTLTTNLTLLTEEIAEFLASHRFHVMVSIDGDREAHDRYRKTVDGRGTYDKVTANLQLLIGKMKKHRTRLPKIRATLTAENTDARAVEEHLKSLGTHLVMVGGSHGTVEKGKQEFDVGGGADGSLLERPSPVALGAFEALAELDRDPEAQPKLGAGTVEGLQKVHAEVTRRQAHRHARPSLCGVCRNMKAVTPTGDIYPCHRYVGMEPFKLGNVHTGGADPEKVRKYYESLYANFQVECAKCWARHLCGGQCPWTLATAEGGVLPPDQDDCALIRRTQENVLGLYAVLLESYPRAFEKLMATNPADISGIWLPSGAPDDSCRS
jgi:uncharacterized protein